jgi:eukaryotic-like serine/threonine-protein kinase
MNAEDGETLGDDEAQRVPGAALSPGALFARRYRVEARLGAGGMGAVYRVRDERLGEAVALKVLTLESAQAVERFVREVRLARRVTHPNVARTHDFGEAEGQSFLTMELVEGDNLDALIQREGAQAPERVVALAEQMAAGLGAAHAAGVIHRDLKPANVMVTPAGRVVLTDFGIARAAETEAHRRTNDLVGTPLYMSPEQVSGRPLDARSDLYSLGLILYELLVGALPFAADTPIAVALARLERPPPDPREKVGVPDDLAAIVLRCLAVDPGGRPASAETLAAELAHWRAARSGVATPSASGAVGAAATMLGRSTPSGLYAPLAAGRSLAVLPFTCRGSADHDDLGEGLAEELVDVLSRTRGLRVMALGATRRFADDRDPARVRAEVGADVVVDGTVQASGQRVRITARLLDAEHGVQRWTERFDGRLEDVFTFQETMARRIAEALRLEVDASAYAGRVPDEAVQCYLRARRLLRVAALASEERGEQAVEMLDRAISLAPGFTHAVAAHAMASVRAWWGASVALRVTPLSEVATKSVARAEEQAPDLAETHFARAMLATQGGDYATAAGALARALEIAPTLAEAHQYLGELQLEAGRLDEGMKRLALALELDPTQHVCRLGIARRKAVLGDLEGARSILDELETVLDSHNVAVVGHRAWVGGCRGELATRVRVAVYGGDLEEVRPLLARMRQSQKDMGIDAQGWGFIDQLQVLLGEGDPREMEEGRRRAMRPLGNARFASLTGQLSVEVLVSVGALDLATEVLQDIADGALVDAAWLESLALLAPLRARPEYPDIAAKVRARASAMWRRG